MMFVRLILAERGQSTRIAGASWNPLLRCPASACIRGSIMECLLGMRCSTPRRVASLLGSGLRKGVLNQGAMAQDPSTASSTSSPSATPELSATLQAMVMGFQQMSASLRQLATGQAHILHMMSQAPMRDLSVSTCRSTSRWRWTKLSPAQSRGRGRAIPTRQTFLLIGADVASLDDLSAVSLASSVVHRGTTRSGMSPGWG